MVGYLRAALRAGPLLVLVGAPAIAAAAAAPTHYTLDASRSLLRFSFVQAGANSTGQFGKYTADVLFSAENLAASKIDVTVTVASIDTGDQERDDTLKGADLFNVARFSQARFTATRITAVGAGHYEALGKLTIRNVTRDLKLPFAFQTKTEQGQTVGYLTGRVTIKRLQYGVGQGEWQSTEWVGDDVTVSFSLRLPPAAT